MVPDFAWKTKTKKNLKYPKPNFLPAFSYENVRYKNVTKMATKMLVMGNFFDFPVGRILNLVIWENKIYNPGYKFSLWRPIRNRPNHENWSMVPRTDVKLQSLLQPPNLLQASDLHPQTEFCPAHFAETVPGSSLFPGSDWSHLSVGSLVERWTAGTPDWICELLRGRWQMSQCRLNLFLGLQCCRSDSEKNGDKKMLLIYRFIKNIYEIDISISPSRNLC